MRETPAVTGPDFGLLAERYDRLRPADANWLEVADAIWAEGDMRGRRVLDVGCGTGRLSALLAERGAKVWGIDSSGEMLERAQDEGSTERRIQAWQSRGSPVS